MLTHSQAVPHNTPGRGSLEGLYLCILTQDTGSFTTFTHNYHTSIAHNYRDTHNYHRKLSHTTIYLNYHTCDAIKFLGSSSLP